MKAFGKTAEVAGEYLAKGKQVYIEGKLQSSSWNDKETGEKKYRTEIIVNELVLLGGKSEGGEHRPKAKKEEAPAKDAIGDFFGGEDSSDSDPF